MFGAKPSSSASCNIPWSDDDDQQLRSRTLSGFSLAEIVGRSKSPLSVSSVCSPSTTVPVGNSIVLATEIESGDAPALCQRSVA
jgi:hypothetical protein